MLVGVTNMDLLRNVHAVWPDAFCIVTAEGSRQAFALYEAGANYVIKIAALRAVRLQKLLHDYSVYAERSELNDMFLRMEWKERINKSFQLTEGDIKNN